MKKSFIISAVLTASSLFTGAVHAQSTASDYTTGYRYDLSGRQTGVIMPDPDGAGTIKFAATRNTYSTMGLLTKVETGELSGWRSENITPASWTGFTIHNSIEYSYDNHGNKLKEIFKANGTITHVKQYSYDDLNRMVCEATRMNPTTYTSLPDSACTVELTGTHGASRITHRTYNMYGNITVFKKAYGTGLQQDYQTYTYNKLLPTSVTDAGGNKTAMNYDGYGRLKKVTYPSTAKGSGNTNANDYESFGYDANGNKTSHRRRNNTTITYSFDNLNRMTLKNMPGTSKDVHYDYNAQGIQLYARFGSTSGQGSTYTYNGFGELLTDSTNMGGHTKNISYLYDLNGNRTRITYPGGGATGTLSVNYTYDGHNRMHQVKENTTVRGTYSYNNKGQRSQLSYSGFGSVTTNYHQDGTLDALAHTISGTNGNVTYSFDYNPAKQVIDRDISNSGYVWNPSSNSTETYLTDGLNRYTSINGSGLTYDNNQNLKSWNGWTYSYDDENRLLSAVKGSTTVSYDYDPLGRMYKQTHNGVVTTYLYDGVEPISDYDSSNRVLRRYINGAGIDERLLYFGYRTSDGAKTDHWYYHTDHQGSVIAMRKSTGSYHKYTYDGFGDLKSGTTVQPFQYTGRRWDAATGLYYYRARFYNPQIGRFNQTDPIGYEDQMNLYAYVANDPMNMVDPSGTSRIRAMQEAAQEREEAATRRNEAKKKKKIKPSLLGLAQTLEALNNEANKLYRGLSKGDAASLASSGFVKRTGPKAGITKEQHALGKKPSQYISVSRSRSVAEHYAANGSGYVIVLDAQGMVAAGVLEGHTGFSTYSKKAQNYVLKDQEMLVTVDIPKTAIRYIYKVPVLNN